MKKGISRFFLAISLLFKHPNSFLVIVCYRRQKQTIFVVGDYFFMVKHEKICYGKFDHFHPEIQENTYKKMPQMYLTATNSLMLKITAVLETNFSNVKKFQEFVLFLTQISWIYIKNFSCLRNEFHRRKRCKKSLEFWTQISKT